ncbi:DUF2243 domain-containing protein [Streptomyces sp. NPDC006261]|uniref:DUF2243 domain-containing protein n=1 Tax=Streptomyces sp. NPDC006261 TaxID=3156739 RepID=UPI0033BCB920
MGTAVRLGSRLPGARRFPIFDGIAAHKLLRLHQIRYCFDITLYAWAWSIGGLTLLLVSLVLGVRARRSGRAASAS